DLSYSDLVIISLFTRAIISSTTLPLSGFTLTGAAFGFGAGFVSSVVGAISGFSSVGAWFGGGVGSCFGSCASNGMAASKAATMAIFRIHSLTTFSSSFSLALPLKAEQYVSQRVDDRLAPRSLHPQHSRRVQPNPFPGSHHSHQCCGIERRLRMESDRDAISLPLHHGNPQAFADGFEGGILQKVSHRNGKRPEAVLQLLRHVRFFLIRLNGRNSLVRPQTQILTRNVILRNAYIKAQAQGRSHFRRRFFAF